MTGAAHGPELADAAPERRIGGGATSRALAVLTFAAPLAVLVLLDRAALGKPLWSDEWATWQFSSLSWPDLWRATSHVDRDLLPYYALVHLARDLGCDITTVRLFSLVCGAVALVATQVVARIVWGRVAAVTAGLVLAANPVFCLWSSQARPTALAYAVVGVGAALVVRWGVVARRVHPVLAALGALLFPTTVLALPAQLFWLWRAHGRAAAVRAALVLAPGVVAVAVWELLWVGQVSELVVASRAGAGDTLRSVDHALGAKGGLPWLHVLALVGAAAVLVAHRSPEHRVARRGVVFAVVLTEGAVACAWAATALGVPMLADNLVVTVPLGAALLIGGLVGHAWFAPANAEADADVGVAFRGGLAVAALLAVSLAGSWWLGRARSDVSLDGMDFVAESLAGNAEVGDVLVLQQPYSTVGYTASLAAALHDRALQATLQDRLPYGAERLVLRRVTVVDRQRSRVATVPASPGNTARRVWVVHLPLDAVTPAYRSLLACPKPVGRHAQVIQTDLELLTCPTGSS